MTLAPLESSYRSLMKPLLEYIDRVDAERPDDFVTIVLTEFVPAGDTTARIRITPRWSFHSIPHAAMHLLPE